MPRIFDLGNPSNFRYADRVEGRRTLMEHCPKSSVKKCQHLKTRDALNLLERDTFIEAFGQMLTCHKSVRVFQRYLLQMSS